MINFTISSIFGSKMGYFAWTTSFVVSIALSASFSLSIRFGLFVNFAQLI